MPFRAPTSTELGGNPLAADDPNLNAAASTVFGGSPAGLRGPASVEFGGSPTQLNLNNNPGSPLGLQGMPNISNADFAQALGSITNQGFTPSPNQDTSPQIFFSPSTGDMVVNGFRFNQRNATAALTSEDYARQPAQHFTLPDTASDWRSVSPQEYAGYINGIRNPGFGRRIGEAWETGWRGVGDIALGASLAVNPNWDWAKTARDNIRREYVENAPFILGLRDVHNVGDGLTYAAQLTVQGIPWFVETLASMAVGALAGGAVSGGLGAPEGAIEGFIAKEAIKRATAQAIRTTLQRGAAAYLEAQAGRTGAVLTREAVLENAARTGVASADDVNRFFNFGERAFHLSRGAREGGNILGSTGSMAGMFGSTYAMGLGDIRDSIADAGGDPTTAESVANIWGLAFPYAAIESLGDIILTQPLTHVLPGVMSGPSRIGNAIRHGLIVAGGEGIEEGAQYGITQSAIANTTNTPLSIEPIDLLENVLGGAFGGLGIGAFTGALETPTPNRLINTDDTSLSAPPASGAPHTSAPPPAGLQPDIPEFPGNILNEEPLEPGQPSVPRPAGWPNPDPNSYTLPPLTPYDAGLQTEPAMPAPVAPAPAVEPAPREAVDYPGNITSQEPIVPGQAAVPFEQNAGLSSEAGSVAHTQNQNARGTIVATERAIMATNSAASRSLQAVTQAIRDNTIIPDEALRNVGQQVKDQMMKVPVEVQAMVPHYAEQVQNLAVHHNLKLLTELNNYTRDAANAYNWPTEQVIRAQELTKQALIGGRDSLTAAAKNSYGEFQGLLHDVRQRRAAQVSNDGLRGRTQVAPAQDEANLAIQPKAEKLKKGKKKNARQRAKARAEQAAEAMAQYRKYGFNKRDQAKNDDVALRAVQATERSLQREQQEQKVDRVKKAGQRAKEARDAVQEQSPASVSIRKQSSSSERVRESDTARSKATRTRQTQEQKSREVQGLQGEEVNQERVDRAHKALLANSEGSESIPAKDPAQTVRGVLNAIARAEKQHKKANLNTNKNTWLQVDGKVLTKEELTALEAKFPRKYNALKKQTTETKPSGILSDKERTKLERLHEDLFAMKPASEVTQEEVDEYNALAKRSNNKLYTQTSLAELQADEDRAFEDKEPGVLEEVQSATELAQAKAEKKAARFGEDLSASFKRTKEDPNDLPEFVAAHPVEIQAWLNSEDAQRKAGIRNMVEQILRNKPPSVQRAALSEGKLARRIIDDRQGRVIVNPTQADLMRETRRQLGKSEEKTDTLRYVDDKQGNRFVGPAYDMLHDDIVRIARKAGYDLKGYIFEHETNYKGNVHGLETGQLQRRDTKVVELPDAFMQLAAKDDTSTNKLTSADAKAAIKKIQANVDPSVRFKSTHVFDGIEDLFARANNEIMHAPNGAEVSLGRYIMGEAARAKLENPELKQYSDAQVAAVWAERNLMGRAAVLNPFKALVVFSNNLKDERELLEVLEHEYVVHSGLQAIFPDKMQRALFMQRVAQIPGIEQKRAALVHMYPSYAEQPYLYQIEEVLAFHSMEGPLALETLLSAPEGVDQNTKRTLWQDFKRLVMEWLSKIFGERFEKTGTTGSAQRDTIDAKLDRIIDALRQHTVLGTNTDVSMHAELTDLNIKETDPGIIRALAAALKENPQMAALPGTPEATQELLYGTNTEPGRPQTPTPYNAYFSNVIKSNLPLMEKLKEVTTKGTATSIKEGMRKVGRVIETMGQKALRSMLIQKMMEIMHNTIGVARSIMTKTQETRIYATTDKAFDKLNGSTEQERKDYGKMAIVATNNRMAAATKAVIRAFPSLIVRGEDGLYDINQAVYEQALKRGMLTKEEFESEKGVEQFVVSGDGERTSTGFAKLPQKVIDSGYNIYVSESRHMANSALTLLKHTLIMLSQKNSVMVAKLIKDNKISVADEPFAHEMLTRMYQLYSDIAFQNYEKNSNSARAQQQAKARDVMVELMRTMHSKEKLADWTDMSRERDDTKKGPRKEDAFKWRQQVAPDGKAAAELWERDVKPFVNQIRWFLGEGRLERMNTIYDSNEGQRQFQMLGAFQGLLNSELLAKQRDKSTIQSVLGNYVEFQREGEWRVFLDVTDEAGNKLEVTPELYAMLPVSYTNSEREAKALREQLGEEFKGTFTINDDEGNPIKAKFDVGYETAPGASTLAEAPNIGDFLKVADVVGLKLSAPQMKQIANLIENAGERKRLGLQRANTPGMDARILQNNSATMTRRAWAAAKTSQAWMLDSIFEDQKNIYGDPELLQRLQDKFDIANRGAIEGQPVPADFIRNEQAVWLAERDLRTYANQMRYMSKSTLAKPTINIRTTAGEQKFKIQPEGRAHLEDANALREALKRNELEVNLNDLLSKTGSARMLAVVLQLGSVASGIMNAFTIVTHLPAVLTANNTKTGYGEGFDLSKVIKEIIAAGSDVMNPLAGLDNSAKLKAVLDAAKAGNNSTNMSVEELEFMYEQTLDGLLAPQQTYSMTGGTESNIRKLFRRNVAEALLKPFGLVEAANRRVSALATYRLAKARYIAAGVSAEKLADHTSDEYKQLITDIQRVVWNSQGDYTNVNSPKAFRGDLAKYVLLYKMFPLMTQQMLNNLPWKAQLSVLAVFFLLGGLKGEPFADDFMDIYDTLLQKLGFRHDSVELELVNMLEHIMPGSSKWIMYGGVDALAFGGTMSSRVSMGDIIPFTGVLRDGADFGREIANAFGPAYSANVAALEYAWLLTDFTMQSMGLKPQVTSWQQLIRQMPQTQLRALGEAGLMLATGDITDPQGRLTSDNVNVFNIFTRALGFYPLESTKANTAVRLDRMHIGYMRNVRAGFILAYAQAYREHDEARMNSLRQQVDNWNASAEATGQDDMMIRNFRSAGVRAGRAASQTTVERTIASAPDYSMLEELAGIMNADTQTDEEAPD